MMKFHFVTRKKRGIQILLKYFYHHQRASQLFQPLHILPKDATVKKDELISLSQKLLLDCGIVRPRGNGMYAFLPLGQRVLAKLTNIIDEEMKLIGAQKLLLPTLTSGHLWKKTGRWELTGDELIKVKDRHEKDYVISPTHEEAVVDMLAETYSLTHRNLPLRLYQISSKFRDEANPRFGLLRCKEFLMKDLYTFDKDEASAVSTYEQVSKAYDAVFQRLGVPYVKVAGDCGTIGGSFSHEYHYPAAIGQDILLICNGCGSAVNSELANNSDTTTCPLCGSVTTTTKGIEVGHTFLLGTKYSAPLNCSYQNEKGKPSLVQMGCYGIGVSRVLAAAVEALSCETGIRWPWVIAPYKVCIISPKRGSKEANAASWVNFLANTIGSIEGFHDDIIIDDRDTFTIGKRVMEAKKVGYPIIIVVGKSACELVPRFELIDITNSNVLLFSHVELLDFLRCK
ncbi:probable proline--tRNA ligase, mitochondrial isoform X1 [Macrobrachium rosenbergii]|uniref:probable proline--tRNA ligase, mitochondrial isoform X1 n=2 Tax=Macrobrachium rosenbergii TaxID=79674 RepID=UPI0034D5693C